MNVCSELNRAAIVTFKWLYQLQYQNTNRNTQNKMMSMEEFVQPVSVRRVGSVWFFVLRWKNTREMHLSVFTREMHSNVWLIALEHRCEVNYAKKRINSTNRQMQRTAKSPCNEKKNTQCNCMPLESKLTFVVYSKNKQRDTWSDCFRPMFIVHVHSFSVVCDDNN